MSSRPPRGPFPKSAQARAMWARGERDRKVIAETLGMSASAVWNALRERQHETSYAPEKPTFGDHEAGMRLATMRGSVNERALAIAEEIAKTRAQAQKGRAA